MINFRIIARVFSLLLIFEGLFMLASAAVSYLYHEQAASSFLYSALITIVTGTIVFTPLRNEERIYGNKEGYIIVTGIWLIFSLFGTLPFIISGSIHSFGDAFFESMSGFTTTGATILTDIESLPHGILFWRSLTQWLGGIGIIFISLSAFPFFKSINIQLTATEFSGQPTDKIHPRIKDAAKRLVTIYVLLTLTEVILLMIGGMPVFDAVCHSFSTLSTGGFSTRNDGIAAFASPYIMIVIILFMFIAGTNLTLVYFGLKGNFKKIFGNNEFVFYTLICLIFALIGSAVLYYKAGFSSGNAILDGAFHVVSIISTTGFYTHDYNLWGNTMIIILFILMFTGGTAGSTSGGIKIVRLLLITKNSRQELKRLIHPNAFIPVRLGKHIIPQNIIYNLLVFITLYFIMMCLGTFVISIMGYNIITSFSTSASMLGNIGPGMGTFGPFTNYSSLPMAGKWFLSGLMLLGRLELLTVMILFTRNFYRH
ncbi:MAG: potassium transporter TrkG [Bacteroidales bacterium]|nr:potassium transporter TrkG [Bacteroidales bacterium]MDP3002413.1 potassium transporter TrkG [Bacteroidales bacterium]